MYCNNCGQNNPDNSKFCQHCGIKLVKVKEDDKTTEESIQKVAEKLPEKEASSPKEKKKGNFIHWLFWWQLDKAELENQVKEYERLDIWHASRKISALLLVFSAAITILAIIFFSWDSSAWVDATAFLVLALLIYRGYRWAMIAAMLLWTYEKIYPFTTSHPSTATSNPVVALIWWATYMHAFYEAFKVEQLRKKGEYVLS